MGKIARYLNQLTVGNVFDAPEILEAYATDMSAVRVKPKLVALPESTEDLRRLMRFCYQLATKGVRLPVAIRGSGLDETGADLTNGLVISTEKLNRLLESDRRERLVRVQAGITLKELNTALSVNGLTIPIDGHEMETIGGLISNCPSDDYAGKYGGIMNYVDRVEVVLSNGDVLQTGKMPLHSAARKGRQRSLENTIYNKLPKIISSNSELVKNILETGTSSAGYPTIAHVVRGRNIDLLPIFFGAQGTLGVISEVILHAVPIKKKPRRVVATFTDYDVAKKFLDLANSLKPRELNIYDIEIIKTAEETGKRLSEITRKMDSGFVVFAKFDDKSNSCIRKISSIRSVLPKNTQLIIDSPKTEASINEFENSLASFIGQVHSGERVPLLTDFYLPAQNLKNFLVDMELLEQNLKLDLALYGSYSASNYSLRPKFKLEDPDFNKKALAFLRIGNYIIERQGGSLAGGTPEGCVKALVTNDSLSENEKKMYLMVKQVFDKYNLLNPNIKLGANARFTVTHFRTTSSPKIVL